MDNNKCNISRYISDIKIFLCMISVSALAPKIPNQSGPIELVSVIILMIVKQEVEILMQHNSIESFALI